MKKYLFSAALVSLLGLAANAQDSRSQQNSNGAKTEQGQSSQPTLQSADHKTEAAEEPKAQKEAPAAKPATRMAITEKGIPASKATETKPNQKAAETKPAATGKP